MNLEQCKVGMYVFISYNISKTDRKFSSNEIMKKMLGEVHKIAEVDNCRECVRIGEYVWDPGDLIELDQIAEKEEMIFHFNPEVM